MLLYALAKQFTYCARSCVHCRRCFISTPVSLLALSYFTVTVFYSGEPDYKPISIELIRFHYAATISVSLISTTSPRLTAKLSRFENRPTAQHWWKEPKFQCEQCGFQTRLQRVVRRDQFITQHIKYYCWSSLKRCRKSFGINSG